MKHTNKALALVLVLVLMLTSVASVFAYAGKASTSGGKLNIWSDAEKIGKGKDYIKASVKNGADLGEVEDRGKNKAGVKYSYSAKYDGYVRTAYVAKVGPKAAAAAPEKAGDAVEVKVSTSGGKLNIWVPGKIGKGKDNIVDSLKNGSKIAKVQFYTVKDDKGKDVDAGYAEVLNDKGEVIGHVRTKYVKKTVAAPDPAVVRTAPKAAVVGGASDKKTSQINVWAKAGKTGKDNVVKTFKGNGGDLGFVSIVTIDGEKSKWAEVYKEVEKEGKKEFELVGYIDRQYVKFVD
ncbi:MAG: hypothetical protein ACOX54_07980 [Christensenellales bacterium]|jgi:hypothetical protein